MLPLGPRSRRPPNRLGDRLEGRSCHCEDLPKLFQKPDELMNLHRALLSCSLVRLSFVAWSQERERSLRVRRFLGREGRGEL